MMLRLDFSFIPRCLKMNKSISFIFLLFIITITSCGKKNAVSSLSNEVLIPIIADLHLAEEMVSKFRIAERDSVRKLYLNEIAQIHKVDTATINKEVKIIQSNPDLSFEIYQEVYKHIDGLSAEQKNKK